jgi:hypothetical protein
MEEATANPIEYVRLTPLLFLLTDLSVSSLENPSLEKLLSIPLSPPGNLSDGRTEFFADFLRAAQKYDRGFIEKHEKSLGNTLIDVSVFFSSSIMVLICFRRE